jgi:hypothetical protein
MTEEPAAGWAANFLSYAWDDFEGEYQLGEYQEFLNLLIAQFKNVSEETDSIFQLSKIKQDGKSIEKHNIDFEKHLVRANLDQPYQDRKMLPNLYLKGLDEGLVKKILERRPTPETLGEVMKAALEENLQYRKFQAFKGTYERKRTHTSEDKPKRKPFFFKKKKDDNKRFRTIRVTMNDSDDEPESDEEYESDVDLDVVDLKDIKCYNCNKMGHFARDCKSKEKKKENQKYTPKDVVKNIRALDTDEQDELLQMLEQTGF